MNHLANETKKQSTRTVLSFRPPREIRAEIKVMITKMVELPQGDAWPAAFTLQSLVHELEEAVAMFAESQFQNRLQESYKGLFQQAVQMAMESLKQSKEGDGL